jgi:peptidoglycan/LPS O-acetylase OafA/YrhL
MTGREHLPSLTPLRGIAALMVILFHIGTGSIGPPIAWIDRFAHRGYLAVDLFFILSGFVLSHVYARDMAAGDLWRKSGIFARARFARLYPVYVLTAAMMLCAQPPGITTAFHDLTFTEIPWLDSFPANRAAWSVSAEIWAYFLFPFLACALWRLPVRYAAILGALIVCAIALASRHGLEHVTVGWPALGRAILEFVLGIATYRLFRARIVGALASDAAAAAIAIAVIGAAASHLPDVGIVMLFPVLIVCATENSGLTSRVLNCRPLTWLGDISYSLYLCQYPAFMIVGAVRIYCGAGAALISVLPTCVAFGTLAYRCVELPARMTLRRARIGSAEDVGRSNATFDG